MLTGKELILATNAYAKEDRSKSWRELVISLAVLAASFGTSLAIDNLYVRIVTGVFSALVLVRLFIIYHDYLHKSILQNSVLAKVIFHIFGWYILAPVSIWERSHNYHHNHNCKLYTSSIGSYPIVTKKRFLASSKTERAIYLWIRHPLTIAFGYLFTFVVGMCIKSIFSNISKHWDSIISLVFHFGIGYLVYHFFGTEAFWLTFILPSFISSAMGSYLFYAQHNFPGVTLKEKSSDWEYLDAALNSSSYMPLSPIMHWFTGNIGYHHIHHANPRIPFYRLPEVFAKMKEFQNPKTTNLSIKQIIACLKLKVWDAEQNKMIGFKEMYS